MNVNSAKVPTKKPLFNKQCRVCGDKATCFNFNGLSCETCKIFFRRNANKSEELKCRREGNCQIDYYSRKCCPACRLNKCFAIGMKMRPPKSTASRHSSNSHSYPSFLMSNKVSVIQSSKRIDINSLLEGDIKAKLAQINDNFTPDRPVVTRLNEIEEKLFGEIVNASKDSFVEERLLKVVNMQEGVTNHIILPVVYISRIIKFCKNIRAFSLLSQADQIRIIKPGYFEILTLRFAFNYEETIDGFYCMENSEAQHSVIIKMDMFDEARNKKVSDQYRKIMFDLKRELDGDGHIRDLLMTQNLFRYREEVSCHELLGYHFSVYRHLLIRYLEQKYDSKTLAVRKYTVLNHLLEKHLSMKEVIVELVKNVDPTKMSHVLSEIYNL